MRRRRRKRVVEIVFCQKGKCSSRVGGHRVEGRGTLQQLVSIIRLLSVREHVCFLNVFVRLRHYRGRA